MALTKEDLQAIAVLLQNTTEPLQNAITGMQKDITDVKLHLENVTDRNISLLAENHGHLIDKLNQAVKVSDKSCLEEIRVNILTEKVEKLEKEIEELKRKTA
ncbi:hypothetical protein K040078D81_13710 [Blautia hominis]|uniref:Uncharacterized protein n=1 Tax=Blautia hominis TaxID=2025493 RepID=A0ABQ0B718_9FIRM